MSHKQIRPDPPVGTWPFYRPEAGLLQRLSICVGNSSASLTAADWTNFRVQDGVTPKASYGVRPSRFPRLG